eukprot:1267379-Rhodomonas_salina.3
MNLHFAAMYTPVLEDAHAYGTRNTFTHTEPTICAMLFSIAIIWLNVIRHTASTTTKIATALAKLILFIPVFMCPIQINCCS